MEVFLERVTQIAPYNAVTSKEKPASAGMQCFYSGYSAHAVMTQYGNYDIMMNVIRVNDPIRTRAHALLWGLCESGHFHVLML